MSELEDPFVPLPPERLLLNLVNDADQIYLMIDKISQLYFGDGRVAGVATGAALKSAIDLL